MVAKATANSPESRGRRGARTDADVVSISDFEKAIRELDGNAETTKILLYGDSGSGKTVLAGTCPNSLILACEPGYISAARVSLGTEVGRRQVREIPDGATLLAGLDYLESGGANNYEWVVLEGATTLQTKSRLGYAAEAFDANPEKRTHRNLPDKPDYFNAQNFIASAVARLVDLPVNVLITAHAMRMDTDEGDRMVLPDFQKREGALSNYVSGLMHCVGFMRPRMVEKDGAKRQVRRILWSQSVDPKTDTIYFAKDQLNRLPRVMDDTSMAEIIAKLEGTEPISGVKTAKPRRTATTRRRA